MFILPVTEKFYIGDVVVVDKATGRRNTVPFHRTFTNLPININRVISFGKKEDVFTKINLKIYGINFLFDRELSSTWFFETENERDDEYEKILLKVTNGQTEIT